MPELQRWSIDHAEAASCANIPREFVAFLRSRTAAGRSDIDGANVIFGELVGNALEHGLGTVTIVLAREHTGLVLSVHDQGTGFSGRGAAPPLQSARGRGLFFVHALAREVIVQNGDDGATISVVLPVELSAGAVAG